MVAKVLLLTNPYKLTKIMNKYHLRDIPVLTEHLNNVTKRVRAEIIKIHTLPDLEVYAKIKGLTDDCVNRNHREILKKRGEALKKRDSRGIPQPNYHKPNTMSHASICICKTVVR